MEAVIQKWGNSQGIRLNKSILSEAHLSVGDTVDIRQTKDGLLIFPVKQGVRGRYKLEDLVKDYPKGEIKEVDFGKPVGGEVW